MGVAVEDPAGDVMYELSLSGHGITVKREISENIARAVVSLVMGGSIAPGSSMPSTFGKPSGAGDASSDAGTRQSIREYIEDVGARRNPDKIVAMASYLKAHGHSTFTKDAVKDQFPKAGESVPANFPRDFGLTVSTGWIAEDHSNPGSFYITSTGEKAIRDGFAAKIRRPRRKGKKGGRTDEESAALSD